MQLHQERSVKSFFPWILRIGLGLAFVSVIGWISFNQPAQEELFTGRSTDLQLELPVLNLKIPSGAQARIREKRKAALAAGILLTSSDDLVDASLVWEEQEIPVRIRLKGDWTDHLEGDKWSYRVECRNGYAWNGLTKFSLQSPETRDFLNEWVFHELLESEDVLTTGYGFIHLKINGNSFGVYAWEEHFAKQLVESRERREGPILKLSEEGIWNWRHTHSYAETGISEEDSIMYSAEITAFDLKNILKDSLKSRQFMIAKDLLWQFQFRKSPIEAVIDGKRWATLLAATDISRTYHSLAWHNLRWYYNPLTGKLEPIGFDGDTNGQYPYLAGQPPLLFNPSYQELFTPSTATPNIESQYLESLRRLSSEAYLNDFFERQDEKLSFYLQQLQREYPDYSFSPSDYLTNAQNIRDFLDRDEKGEMLE